MGHLEAIARGLVEVVLHVLARGEGDGVDERVEASEFLADLGEDRVDLAVDGDVARQQQRVGHRRGQRLDTLLQPLALVGEGEAHPLARERLRDGPGDGALVGDTEDDAGTTFE